MEENEMEEWEIVEHNNFRDIIHGNDENRGSKLEWMLETGLRIGKNVVVTGVIISSIPILVPPFVVVAALGCAFSLPIGFAFATYACTNKLMAKLLPAPSPPPPPPPPPYYYPEGEEKQMEAAVKDDVVARIELDDDFDDEVDDNNNNKPPFGSVGPDPATINAEKTDLYAAAADAEDIKFAEKEGGEKGIGIVLDDEKADREEDKRAPSAGSDDVVNIDDSSLVEEHEVIVDEEQDMGEELGQGVDMSKTSTGGESYDDDQAKTVAGDEELKHDNDQIPRDVDVEHEVFVETNDKSETSTVVDDVDVVFSEIDVDVFTNDEGVVDKKIEVRSVTIYNEPAGGNDNQEEAKTVADDEVKEEKKDTSVVGEAKSAADDEVKEEKKDTSVVGDGARSDEVS